MERKAQEAEWASIKYKQVEFLLSRIGDHFPALISGVTKWGIFVEIIENKCEGMVRTDSMRDDHYVYIEDSYTLRGSRHGREYTIGDKVEVKVIGADLLKRQLDFEVIV
jgi:ribonuclease R